MKLIWKHKNLRNKLMPELIMLCGIPTSGKSTWIKNNTMNDYVILSTDNIIEDYAKNNHKTYNDVYDEQIKVASRIMDSDIKNAVLNERNIIWDQTNLTIKTRKNKLRNIPSTYKKTAIYFDIPLDICLKRNDNREGKFIPIGVLYRMYLQVEKPTLKEGFDFIYVP